MGNHSEHGHLGSTQERVHAERQVDALKRALGPKIIAALEDPALNEIQLNPDGRLYFDGYQGKQHVGELSPVAAREVLQALAAVMGVTVNERKPILSGNLPFRNERFHGALPPVSHAPFFAIRLPPRKIFTLAEYVAQGAMTLAQQATIEDAIVRRKNVVIAGGTKSGKTTFTNAVLEAMARLCPETRLVTIEDVIELQCALQEWLPMFVKPGAVEMVELLYSCLRLTPDRIAVGEVRTGMAALEMLKLWNTGHPGGVATIHADGAEDSLWRLDEMLLEVTENSMTRLIGKAVDVVIFIEYDAKLRKRRVRELVEVSGFNRQTGEFTTRRL